MQVKQGDSRESAVREAAARFLDAVKNGDFRVFWNSLDNRGQGYFLGIWFYAMETMQVETIIQLTKEDTFMEGVLGPIINGLRESMGSLLETPLLGEVRYCTPHSASIRVSPGEAGVRNRDHDNFIPLVLELSDEGGPGGNINFTCWKIDTLQCFQLNKAAH